MLNANQVKCYDNGGKSFDRFTAVFPPVEGRWTYLAMNETPFHPCGFGQHGELTQRPGKHLGKLVKFESMPVDCQKLIQMELADE